MLPDRIKNKVIPYLEIDTDACMPYPIQNEDGYGAIQYVDNFTHVHKLAHRVVYELYYKDEIKWTDIICHHCDNPACCNPKHLFKGTHTDNVTDRDSKNRQAKGIDNGRYLHGYYSKYNPVSKPKPLFEQLCGRSLTKEQVGIIKLTIANKGSKSLQQVSIDLGIKYQTLKDINCGRTYSSITI